ncbi:MAG: iron-sulfur cluster repair protein YtfE [Sandaracinaceae bacterium]|nr:iron-sulfur cluster repair protein YtfE [Sandaracinaceae bacterium]
MISPDQTLGSIATEHPESTAVFLRHRLDFCCGGGRKLDEACAKAGLDVDALIAEIDGATRPDELQQWDKRPLTELADFIVTRYHEPLRRDLPALIDAAKRVERVHGQKPSCPKGLAVHLEFVAAELEEHMGKEERVLFPAIRTGYRGQQVHMPIRVMLAEHDDHGANLARTRALATDFVPPPEACSTWRALYVALENLEMELMQHIHLENNVLFPRALGQ